MGETENDVGRLKANSDGVGGGERDFTANRPEGFNHSKTLKSYWGYQNILREQLCQTVAPQQCPSPR